MRLNLQTDYSLRLLMFLAANENGLVTIAEVAKHYGISRNHLMKVAMLLTNEGFIESVRGRSGGLRLARAPDRINIGDVVRRTEDMTLLDCLAGGGDCILTPACRLRGILGSAVEAFAKTLDQFALSDLLSRNRKLQSLLTEKD